MNCTTMINLKEWITEREFSFQTIGALVFFLVGAPVTIISLIIPNIKDYFPQGWVHLFIILLVEIIIITYWYWNRAVFPSCNKNKGNIVVAIVTENAKQKTRITHDFKNEIEKQLIKHNLADKYTVTILHNHLSRITQNKISLYIQSLNGGIRDSEDVIEFKKLKERLNAKFIIYGDLITRNASNSTYCLSLEAIMCHPTTTLEGAHQLNSEFKDLWKKEITFLEENELTGFKENAKYIFFTASYMLGLATFIDNNFTHGIEIWCSLERFIEDKTELSKYKEKIKHLKATSFILQSRLLYFNGNIKESVVFRERYLSIIPNEYDKYLNEAINQVKLRNDPEMALEFIYRAKNIAPVGNGVWRYSEFYLLIKLGRFKDALDVLDRILQIGFNDEWDVVNQVVSYNQTCLNDDKKHVQSYFIIGALIYKKLNMPIPAYEKLEEFVARTAGEDFWLPLTERAKVYITEINKIIGVKN